MNNTTSSNSGNAPSREKYWSELDDKEKIERMRQMIKSMQYQMENLSSVAHGADSLSKNHIHDASGQVFKKADSFNIHSASGLSGLGRLASPSGNPDEVYF